MGGPLGYNPWSTITYLYYQIDTIGVWHLGTYLPNVQSCWIDIGEDCAVLPTSGLEFQVGTSKL
jgi:hypothetical protein